MHAQQDNNNDEAEGGEAVMPLRMPEQEDLTKSIIKHWPDHKRIQTHSGYSKTRGDRLRTLHCTMTHPAVANAPAGSAGSSTFANAMVDNTDDEGADAKPRELKWTYLAFMSNC